MTQTLSSWWHLFLSFLVTNILGYGGGPSTIPLFQNDIVSHYHWMTNGEFGDVLAIANALPGPIATKIAGYVGYHVGGPVGTVLALLSTVIPSAVAVILFVKFADKFKDKPQVKALSKAVQPVIAVMLFVLAVGFVWNSKQSTGWLQTGILTVLSFLSLQVFKVHPALVIVGSLAYGAIFLS